MSVHVPGFQSFSGIFYHFILAELGKPAKGLKSHVVRGMHSVDVNS